MLILTRKRSEQIVATLPTNPETLLALAGQPIIITVVEQRASRVRIGIKASADINIRRAEIDISQVVS